MTNESRNLQTLLKELVIPPDLLRLEALQDSHSILKIERWKEMLTSRLSEILVLLRNDEAELSVDEKAHVLFVLLPYIPSELWLRSRGYDPPISTDEWSTAESLGVAKDFTSLSIISSPSMELLNLVLTNKLRPIFKSSPHPRLSSQTGRKVGRPAGGAMAMQDYYEGQVWKQYPGIANVVLWCIDGLESKAFEHMWHLIVPPVMTLLDDFEARYKVQGVIIVREMLPRLPKGLIKRTGVDGLIQQSLRASLAHLQSSESPELITTAIRTSVDLTLLTTGATPTSEQFDQLSSLLGEGIVSGIWLYAEDKPTVVRATFEALPCVIKALGMGTIRFLQVLIPQLTHTLIPRQSVLPQRGSEVAALNVLTTLLDVCGPRINSWKETILDGVGRCWVGIKDEEAKTRSEQSRDVEGAKERENVKKALQAFCVELAQVCPSIIQEEYPRFLDADKALFQDLLSGVANSVPSDGSTPS